ncbi:uncharacterized protein LOC129234353 [Uloborus diversus]|uniref:uncharacterized protein LOC129234353 n=1 Tax=Uloborus diversus TaxID=327109 RepID=UPI00240A8DC5|nr:uncharacterized protein LOC129234353 [Uloborus diversus]
MEENHSDFHVFEALDIVDFSRRCKSHLSAALPSVKQAIRSLKELSVELKTTVDYNGLEYDSSLVFRFLKKLPERILFDMDTMGALTRLRYLYFKKKLMLLLRNNLLNDYIACMRMSLAACPDAIQTEVKVDKLLKVCDTIQLDLELSESNASQYEFMAELLELCFHKNIQNSPLIVSLLKATIDWYAIEPSDTRHVRQPFYPQGFFEYILNHATKERFDIQAYCENNPKTLWEYSRKFSILNAVAFGNISRTSLLLQHGFKVFTSLEQKKSGHGFPFVSEIIPPTYLMILQMMNNIRYVNLLTTSSTEIRRRGLYFVTNDQKRCFYMVWRAIPEPYVRYAEMVSSVFNEYVSLAKHLILYPGRCEKNSKFCLMYENNFMELSFGPKEPRSLKHLARCKIRQNLRASSALPYGIYELELPKSLQRYLNLEDD